MLANSDGHTRVTGISPHGAGVVSPHELPGLPSTGELESAANFRNAQDPSPSLSITVTSQLSARSRGVEAV